MFHNGELFALWKGVVGLERHIKGFHTFVYMDHKNNLFSEAQLDNRRRSKKMSNWALELQQFDIVRVWIRGEANILADAPSRAPWDAQMARHLPIPDMPLRDIIRQMYVSPEAWHKAVDAKTKKMNLDNWQAVEMECHPHAVKVPTHVERDYDKHYEKEYSKDKGAADQATPTDSPSQNFLSNSRHDDAVGLPAAEADAAAYGGDI